MSEMILQGYPGYKLILPDNENPQTTAYFADHLRELALRRYEAHRKLDLDPTLNKRREV